MNNKYESGSIAGMPEIGIPVERMDKAFESIRIKLNEKDISSELSVSLKALGAALNSVTIADLGSSLPAKLEHLTFMADGFARRARTEISSSFLIDPEINEIHKSAEVLFERASNMARIGDSSDLRVNLRHMASQLSEFQVRLEKTDEQITKLGFDLAEQTAAAKDELALSLEANQDKADVKVEEMDAAFKNALKRLSDYEAQVLAAVDSVAEGALAKGYAGNAEEEKREADKFRSYSVFLMLLATAIAIYFFRDLDSIGLPTFLTKLSLIFVLLIPVTYTARESSRHRTQQHQHLQTALDLKASTPYLASIPKELADRTKVKIATRIFFPRSDRTPAVETSPINLQEIILKIADKLEIKTK